MFNPVALIAGIPGAKTSFKGVAGGKVVKFSPNAAATELSPAGYRIAIEKGGGAKVSVGGKGEFLSGTNSAEAPTDKALELLDNVA